MKLAKIIKSGSDITLVGSSYSTQLALDLSEANEFSSKFNAEVIDLRILNPLKIDEIIKSVQKTGKLVVIDGGKNLGYASEIISSVVERIDPSNLKNKPLRITLPDCPAPTSIALEKIYYPTLEYIYNLVIEWDG